MKMTIRPSLAAILILLGGAVHGAKAQVNPALYVDPDSSAATWARNNPSDGRATDIRTRIANQPGARWFGNWSGEIGAAVGNYVGTAAYNNRTPVLVAYNIPARDCGQHSAGVLRPRPQQQTEGGADRNPRQRCVNPGAHFASNPIAAPL